MGLAAIAIDVGFLAGTYYIYGKLKDDQEYLVKMEDKMPMITDAFHLATQNQYRIPSADNRLPRQDK